MDLTTLAALVSGLIGAFFGFVIGLRVCGPKLQTTWTERHPHEIACEVREGRRRMGALHPHTRRLVARELDATIISRPDLFAEPPLQLNGVEHRYRVLSAEDASALSAERTPRRTR